MSEVSFTIADRQVATVRLDPNGLHGRDQGGLLTLYLPLRLQLLPGGPKGDVNYTVLRLAGTIQNQALGEFARFEVDPIAAVPNPNAFERPADAIVTLDRTRIRRFEDARAGGNAQFQIRVSCLVWYPSPPRFEAAHTAGFLEVQVPRSHWVDNVLTSWNLSTTKVVEIRFPKGNINEDFRNSYAKVDEAEKHFASGHYKEVLTALRLAFEGLGKAYGLPGAGKDFFESLFVTAHPDKREKVRDALTNLYKFLNLGPHVQANLPGSNAADAITRQDARFALTMTYAILEYIASVP